jgi:hypothetical protein
MGNREALYNPRGCWLPGLSQAACVTVAAVRCANYCELLVVEAAAQLEDKFEAFDFGRQKDLKPFEARHDGSGLQSRLFGRRGGGWVYVAKSRSFSGVLIAHRNWVTSMGMLKIYS